MTREGISPAEGAGPSRRRFLGGLGAFGLVGLDLHVAAGAWPPRPPSDLWATRLQALVPHAASAVVVGREYLRLAPDARRPGPLAALLSTDHCGNGSDWDVEEVRRRVDRRIRQDFDEGEIVTLHGWMLALTEVRICALLAACLEPGCATAP
jgi:hypothetical protein